jgi:hypothetical protein
MSNVDSPIDVIYIIGSGRSGSTVLGSVLGAYPDIVNTGEIYNFKHFFDSAAERNRKCSCGEELQECGFWKRVKDYIYEKTGKDLVEPKDTDPGNFGRNNYVLFSAIQAVSGRRIILDSSKRHYRLNLLLKSPHFRVTILHLVRDARAYAYSSMLTEMKKGASSRVFFRKLWEWQHKNIAMKFLYGRNPRYYFCRYEDFVCDPKAVIGKFLSTVGLLNRADLSAVAIYRSEEHQFSGNNGVFNQDELHVRKDTRYLEKVSGAQWMVGTILVVFALILFGYPLARKLD